MNTTNKTTTQKFLPKVGDRLYLRQYTSNYYVNIVKRPYTVVEVTPSKVVVQKCKLTPPVYHCCGNPMLDRPDLEGQRVWFYDTVAETIEEDPNGSTMELSWHARRGMWGEAGRRDSDYPMYAVFGAWEHQPYLD